MGLIKGGLLFILSSLLLFSLIFGNLFLTLSLSLEKNDFRSEIISNIVKIDGEDINLTKEIEENFHILEEDCENNTNILFNQGGYDINISCEVVEQGPDAVLEEGINDVIENVVEEAYPNSSLGGYIEKLLLSDDASDYWMRYFYFILIISAILIVVKFILTEEKFNFPISLGFLVVISSLPFAVINFLLSFLENSFLKPLISLFSESYTVFLVALISGIILIILGFGFKFFKMGWSLSEKFGKIKNLFSRKSKTNISQEIKK